MTVPDEHSLAWSVWPQFIYFLGDLISVSALFGLLLPTSVFTIDDSLLAPSLSTHTLAASLSLSLVRLEYSSGARGGHVGHPCHASKQGPFNWRRRSSQHETFKVQLINLADG